nr:MAG TPA: hypothetical protein [Caudoviricetes sp.]DAS95065.1 MAG TPA: hypothetical protein [Caudoviricetes sp.]DAY32549.1 MAG TPA: hypothetical protein [Caudoviricetes sp.]
MIKVFSLIKHTKQIRIFLEILCFLAMLTLKNI